MLIDHPSLDAIKPPELRRTDPEEAGAVCQVRAPHLWQRLGRGRRCRLACSISSELKRGLK